MTTKTTSNKPIRRLVRLCTDQPNHPGQKCRIYGYGNAALAKRAGCCMETVQRAIRSGALQIDDLGSCEAWVADKKAKKERTKLRKRKAKTKKAK